MCYLYPHIYIYASFSQEQKFKEREKAMMAKNAALEESFVSFSKYLQENDAKKARASKRAIDEARTCEERAQEAENLVHLNTWKAPFRMLISTGPEKVGGRE